MIEKIETVTNEFEREIENNKADKALLNNAEWHTKKDGVNVLTGKKLSKKTRKEGKVQTSIGKKILIDKETGEETEVLNVVREGKDINFDRIFLGQIIEAVGEIGNAKIKLLLYLFTQKNNENIIVKTQRKMCEETGLSTQTVSATIKSLMTFNFLIKVNSGAYMINPDMIFKGSADRRMDILLTYKQTKSDPVTETKIGTDPETFVQTDGIK